MQKAQARAARENASAAPLHENVSSQSSIISEVMSPSAQEPEHGKDTGDKEQAEEAGSATPLRRSARARGGGKGAAAEKTKASPAVAVESPATGTPASGPATRKRKAVTSSTEAMESSQEPVLPSTQDTQILSSQESTVSAGEPATAPKAGVLNKRRNPMLGRSKFSFAIFPFCVS